MKANQGGFTLSELTIVVAIIGVLAAVAVLQYQNYIVRSQVAEAFTLFNGGKAQVQANLQAGICTSDIAAEDTLTGKYGSVVVSGTAAETTGATNDSGCILTYTFKAASSGVSLRVASKTIIANVLNNGSIIRGAGTIDAIYLPKSFK